MGVRGYFSNTYGAARDKFRYASRQAGAVLETHHNPASGPGGERLATDVALLGPRDASRILIVIAGTHGVEGFCGSAIQTGWLSDGVGGDLPRDTAVLLVHAINPYGFAWLRRVNEDNVDINRNFIDWSRPCPVNRGYEELHDALCPREWTRDSLAATESVLAGYAERHGQTALRAAIATGQYCHPEGLFYGGASPSWSVRVLTEIMQRHAGHARRVALVDLHTGLGPYGFGEIMHAYAATAPGHRRCVAWFGEPVTSVEVGALSSAALEGDTIIGAERILPNAELTAITLEFGTEPINEVLDAIRADNWLHLHGDPRSALGRRIKARIRRAFFPDADDWKTMVWDRALQVRQRLFDGMTTDCTAATMRPPPIVGAAS